MTEFLRSYIEIFIATLPLLAWLFFMVKRRKWKSLRPVLRLYQIMLFTGFLLLLLPIRLPLLPEVAATTPQFLAENTPRLETPLSLADNEVSAPSVVTGGQEPGLTSLRWFLLRYRLLFLLFPTLVLMVIQRIRKLLYIAEMKRDALLKKTDRVHIFYSPGVHIPFASGTFRKEIFIPLGMKDTSAGRIALIHELQHLNQVDPLWNELDLLISSLFWFNPLHRWVQSCHNFSKEVECDRKVLSKVSLKQYLQCLSETLENSSVNRIVGIVGLGEGKTGLMERMRTMKDASNESKVVGRRVLSVFSAVILAGLWFSQAACSTHSSGSEAYDLLLASIESREEAFYARYEGILEGFAPLKKKLSLPFAPGTSYSIASAYGQVPHPVFCGQSYLHKGVTLLAERGTNVYPVAPGVVFQSVSNFRFLQLEDKELLRDPVLYGNYVVLYHGKAESSIEDQGIEIFGHWFSFYSHLGDVQVEKGQYVTSASTLGTVGRSGAAVEPCLELEIQSGYRRGFLDPEIYLDFSEAEQRSLQVPGYHSLLKNPRFSFPLAPETGSYVTAFFGYQLHPIMGKMYFHKGLDIAATRGSSIFPAAPGKILKVNHDSTNSYGKYIIIDHGNGFFSFYAHLDEIRVEEGQRISLKEEIGLLGKTGLSTGPHLHFEIWYGDKRNTQDPAAYIDLRG